MEERYKKETIGAYNNILWVCFIINVIFLWATFYLERNISKRKNIYMSVYLVVRGLEP